jgi:hypothetical protein
MASDIALVLKSAAPQNVRLFATPGKAQRPDVAEYFKNPAAVNTGFVAEIDVAALSPGEYLLEVLQHKGGKVLKCGYTANLTIEK